MVKVVNRKRLVGCLLLACAAPFAEAGKLKLDPTLSFKATYANNVNTAASGQAEHDWVVQATPGLILTGTGARLQFSANYAMQNQLYLRHKSQNRVQHQLGAQGRAELNPNLLFVDAYLNISQQNLSPFSSGLRDETSLNFNRTDVTSLGVSPYLRLRFEDHWLSELRYSHNRMVSDASSLSDSQMDSLLFSVNQNVPGKRASWGASYRYAVTSNKGDAVDFDQLNLMANGRYRITPKVGVLANVGYEKYSYHSIGDSPEGTITNIGLFWTPNARGLLDLSIGKRFYGTSYTMSGRYRLPYGEVSASYNEDISTSQSRYFMPLSFTANNGANPLRFTENVNVLSNRIFLDKRLQADLSLRESHSSLGFSASYARREAQNEQQLDSVLLGNLNSAITDRSDQLALGAVWGWQFLPRTSSQVSLRYQLDDFEAVNTDVAHWSLRMGLSRQFQRDLKGSLEYAHHRSDGSPGQAKYHNNSISANLDLTF